MQEQNGDPQQSGRSSEKRSQLNHLKRLLADRHYRDTQQRFVVEGILVHIQNMATASSDYSDRRLPVRRDFVQHGRIPTPQCRDARTGTPGPVLKTTPALQFSGPNSNVVGLRFAKPGGRWQPVAVPGSRNLTRQARIARESCH